MSFDSAFSLSRRFSVSVAAPSLFSRRIKLLIAWFPDPIPPAAAERLEQAGRVSIAIRLRLHHGESHLEQILFRAQHGDRTDRPQLALLPGQVKTLLRS